MKTKITKIEIIYVFFAIFIIFCTRDANALNENKIASKIDSESIEEFIENWTNLSYRVFTDKDGLVHNSVTAMSLDSDGYLWIGTQNGVSVYDGVGFQNFSLSNLINEPVNNYVSYIYSSKDKSLWISTEDGNILVRKDNIWKRLPFPNNFLKNKIKYISEEYLDKYHLKHYVVTKNHVLVFENEKWSVLYQTDHANNIIRQGEHYVNKNNKLELFLLLNNSLVLSYKNNKFEYLELPNYQNLVVYSMFIGKTVHDASEMTLSTNYGVFIYDIINKNWSHLLTIDQTMNISAKHIWKKYSADYSNSFLFLLDNKKKTLLKYSYRSKKVYDLSRKISNLYIESILTTNISDVTEYVWVGTFSKGLLQFSNNLWSDITLNQDLKNYTYSYFHETKDKNGRLNLWLGTFNDGLVRIDSKKIKIFNKNNGLCSNSVVKILESYDEKTKNSIFWIGTMNGLAKIENDTITCYFHDTSKGFVLPGNAFKSLLETKNDTGDKILFIGTQTKFLKLINNDLNTIQEIKNIPEIDILQMVETKTREKNIIYLAGKDGLFKYEDNEIKKIYNQSTGLPQSYIYSIFLYDHPNGKRELWVGTQSSGFAITELNALNNDNPIWKIFNQNNFQALPDNTIYSIIKDNSHRIYLFTNKGALRLNTSPYSQSIENIKPYVFNTGDGLPSNEFNQNASYYSPYDHIWASTANGAVFYSVKDEFKNSEKKILHLDVDIIVDGVKTALTKSVLSHKESNIIFNFRLLSYFKEKDTMYSYHLDGLTSKPSKWNAEYKKEFTTLPDGSYNFKLWAKDFDGNVVGPRSFSFTINPPPWKTKIAILSYIMFFSLFIWRFINWRLKTAIAKQKELELIVDDKTKEVKFAMKSLDEKNQMLLQNNIEISKKNVALLRKNEEIELAYEELSQSRLIAEKIFSALAVALPGTILDNKYQLEDIIGTGGFSVVYRAKHLILNKSIAIKIFKPQANNLNNDSLQKFLKEGSSACRVNHMNAVLVLDTAISDNGVAYIVMELLEGETLAQKIEKQKIFTIKESLEIIEPICSVLSYAHSIGIIHRDIKPENIFLHHQPNNTKCLVKILDFGIAKEIFEDKSSIRFTQSQSLEGTPRYMPPERLLGLKSDEKVDVYSFGMVIYEMLSGGFTPFKKEVASVSELIAQHLNETPIPLYIKNSYITKTLSDCIDATLEKETIKRPNINQFWESIQNFSKTNYIDNMNIKNELKQYHKKLDLAEKENITVKLDDLNQNDISDISNTVNRKNSFTDKS